MNQAKTPRTLRSDAYGDNSDNYSGRKVTAVAGLMAVASFSGAEAQQSTLPPVTVDAPIARPRPAASKPTPDQLRARTALRRAARRAQPAQVAPVPFPNAGGLVGDRNPYADPSAPYKGDRLAGNKFSEPLLNTPRTVTVLTRDILADKNATSLKDVARSTAGVTLGTGEGGNAFGDRFFIRGFDARNDVFIDGIRDPAVSIRENFFTEQVEILRGPASSFAGRGTAGGAINTATKQATNTNFQKAETTLGTDRTKRVTVDVNQVISPTLAVRVDGLFQDANVAGRNYVTDNRWGTLGALKWTPTDAIKVTANYVHTDLSGLPDYGVPYNAVRGKPVTELNVDRNTYYGFVNRDFQKATQDFGTVNAEVKLTPDITLANKTRVERSVLDYVGTLPSSATDTTVRLSSQSKYQVTDTVANVTDATFKFDTGPVKHTTIIGAEFSQEKVMRDNYTGLTSELSGIFSGNAATVSLFAPPNEATFASAPQRAYSPTNITVDTKAGYAIHTANYQDIVILNGGIRYDDYEINGTNSTGAKTTNNSGMFNYNVGAVYKPVPIGSLYAAYATSSNPVGAELDATSAAYGGSAFGNLPFQALSPEENKAAEVGTKWELFDRHLLVTAALFQTVKSNARETSGSNVIAGAEYHVRGIDLGMGGKITDKWSMFAGAVFRESRVEKAIDASQIGVPLANIAHQSFNMLTKYKITDAWEIGGQATSNSKIFGGTLGATTGNVLPSYWRFDAFTEYRIDKHMKAKLSVNNIFDKVYYDAFYRSASPFVFIAPGRSVWLTLSGSL
ncbi:TonB-dependent receptor [soil metagenome]